MYHGQCGRNNTHFTCVQVHCIRQKCFESSAKKHFLLAHIKVWFTDEVNDHNKSCVFICNISPLSLCKNSVGAGIGDNSRSQLGFFFYCCKVSQIRRRRRVVLLIIILISHPCIYTTTVSVKCCCFNWWRSYKITSQLQHFFRIFFYFDQENKTIFLDDVHFFNTPHNFKTYIFRQHFLNFFFVSFESIFLCCCFSRWKAYVSKIRLKNVEKKEDGL